MIFAGQWVRVGDMALVSHCVAYNIYIITIETLSARNEVCLMSTGNFDGFSSGGHVKHLKFSATKAISA